MNQKSKLLLYMMVTFAVIGLLFTANFAIKTSTSLFRLPHPRYSMMNQNSTKSTMMNTAHCN